MQNLFYRCLCISAIICKSELAKGLLLYFSDHEGHLKSLILFLPYSIGAPYVSFLVVLTELQLIF